MPEKHDTYTDHVLLTLEYPMKNYGRHKSLK